MHGNQKRVSVCTGREYGGSVPAGIYNLGISLMCVGLPNCHSESTILYKKKHFSGGLHNGKRKKTSTANQYTSIRNIK